MASPSAMTSSRAACVLLLTAAVMMQAVSGQATVTTQQIVQKLKDLTTLSEVLRSRTENLDLVSAISSGPSIAQDLDRITESVNDGVTMLSVAALSDADAKTVVAALTEFVQQQQGLLKALIGKHRLLTLVPFFGSIDRSLVALKASVDSFAKNLIAIIPTQKPAADQQFRALTVALQAAISIYQQPL